MLYAGRSAISSLPEAAWGDDLAGSGGLSPPFAHNVFNGTPGGNVVPSKPSDFKPSNLTRARGHKMIASLSSNVFAAFRSELSKPSVYRSNTGASRSCAS